MKPGTTPTDDGISKALAELRPEIRAMLSEDLPEERRQAEYAYAQQDWASLQAYVHRLHGTALFCHLESLRVICTDIETGLKQQRPPADAHMHALAAEIDRILAQPTL